VRDKISKLIVLNPAESAVRWVAMMDWVKWVRCKKTLLSIQHYLHGDCSRVFEDIIGTWRWDAQQFQNDLNYYHYIDQRTIEQRLDWLKKEYFMLRGTQDAISREWIPFDEKKPLRLLRHHIPNSDAIRWIL
jgi:hypothetical protein